MLFSQQVFLVAGLSRSGVSAAEFLLSRGAKVYAYDDAEGESVQKAIASLSEQGCRIVHREELSERAKECDILVLSPGIPIDHPLALLFRKRKRRVTGEMELGALALSCPAVAVTGTNGKTTTVTMLERIFRAAGKECFACGNSGLPLTSAAEKLKSSGVAAVEVSSFQLETLSSLRPHVAVVLNIAEDHLDRHYSMENYIYLKRKLLKNCTESEYAVLDRDDPVVRSFAEHTKAQIVWFSVKERVEGAYLEDDHLCFKGEKVLSTDDLSVRGEHNLANALAALAAAKLMGAGNEAIASYLHRRFQGDQRRFLPESGRGAGQGDGAPCRREGQRGAFRSVVWCAQTFARRACGALRRVRPAAHECRDGGKLHRRHPLPPLRGRSKRRLPYGAARAERAPLARRGELRRIPQFRGAGRKVCFPRQSVCGLFRCASGGG